MGEVSTIGLDLAKAVFQAHGADRSGAVVFRKKLRRDQLLAFFAGAAKMLDGNGGSRDHRVGARNPAHSASLCKAG